MADDLDTQRTIGRIEGELQALQREWSIFRADYVAQTDAQLKQAAERARQMQEIMAALNQARGGWRILMGASAAGGTIAAIGYKLWHIIMGASG